MSGFALQRVAARTGTIGASDAFEVAHDNVLRNVVAAGGWALMSFGLCGFAVAIRAALGSAEGEESSYSGLAHAGALVTATAAAFVSCSFCMLESTVMGEAVDAAGTITVLPEVGWIMVSIGVVPMLWGVGVGARRLAVLPRWFSTATVVVAVLATLGALRISPGGAVVYLLLAPWLMTASVLL